MIRLAPAYTLEMLDNCDIERLLPYYFFDYRLCLRNKKQASDEEIVEREGKKYKVVSGRFGAGNGDIL